MEFSVVIPTFNRAPVLARTLEALTRQSVLYPPLSESRCPKVDFEVIVVDDGSTDHTTALVAEMTPAYPVPLVCLRQPNRKQGAARNLGSRSARGDFLVFLGDDIVPTSEFLLEHYVARLSRGEARAESRLAVIGYTHWAASCRRTRFTKYIGEYGWQFGFALISDPEQVPFNFFYTSNLSIPRRFFLDSGGFDEDFKEYGWEDIELSVRLTRQGMRLVYHAKAVAGHDHPTSFSAFVRRQRRVGFSAWKFYQKQPEMSAFLGVFRVPRYTLRRRLQMWLLTLICSLLEDHERLDLSKYYPDLMTYHYNLGILQARHARHE